MYLEDTDKICGLHGLTLVTGRVPVLYGLIRHSESFNAARELYFPKSKFRVLGGCVDGNIFIHQVNYCSKCRENHLEWAKKNNSQEGLSLFNFEGENYAEYIAVRSGVKFGITKFVLEHIERGEIAATIKMLKTSNPDLSVFNLKKFITSYKLNRNFE